MDSNTLHGNTLSSFYPEYMHSHLQVYISPCFVKINFWRYRLIDIENIIQYFLIGGKYRPSAVRLYLTVP